VKTLQKTHGLITRTIDDECMILNPEDGYMHLLNVTGKDIWEFLDTCATLEELIETMYKYYNEEISREILKNDISEIINSLKEHNLIKEQDDSDSDEV
jgi:hypothetical protein